MKKSFEDRRLEVLAVLRQHDVLSYTDLCRKADIPVGGYRHLFEKFLKESELVKCDHINVTLFYLPDVPPEAVEVAWKEKYKPANPPSRLKINRRNQYIKRNQP